MLGEFVDRALERLAAWVCEHRPADVAAPNSTDGKGLRGYVIHGADGSPYMTRILFPRVFGVRPMLHHLHRPDEDRDLHDHPWAWAASLILRGAYDEERLTCESSSCEHTERRRVRWFNLLRGDDFHRIERLHGNVWTLFVTGPRVKGWGFREWDPGYEAYAVTPHRDYFAKREVWRVAGAELDNLALAYGITRFEPITSEMSADPSEVCDIESDDELRQRIEFAIDAKRAADVDAT